MLLTPLSTDKQIFAPIFHPMILIKLQLLTFFLLFMNFPHLNPDPHSECGSRKENNAEQNGSGSQVLPIIPT